MSQFDWGVIDPNSKSGPQLALDLNDFRDAVNSLHRGSSRPAYAQPGMLWVREVTSERWDLLMFDGQSDLPLRSFNPTTSEIVKFLTSEVEGLDAALGKRLQKDAATTTGAALIPSGTPEQRPGAPVNGMLRYNATTGVFEGYQGGAWKPVAPSQAWGSITGTLSDQADLQSVLTGLQSNQKITKKFVSGELAISASALISAPHALGTRPEILYMDLICKVAEGGWSVGDVVPLSIQILEVADASRGMQMYADATNLYAKISGAPVIGNKSTGALFTIAFTNWRSIMRAYA